ncbi:MAG: nucleotidyltransferase family protein [Nitrospirae bacterium]|nr:nucleotidyltransferase family protein [Nitrospirota bacterium]
MPGTLFLTTEGSARPEIELLLRSARHALKSDGEERVQTLLQEKINWERLLQTASRHGVMPLLFRHINVSLQNVVPPEFHEQLKTSYDSNTRRNLFLTGELCAILDGLEAHGIQAIPLKGPVLAETLYGDIASRQFCDLDILVQKRQVLKAKELMIARGYREGLRLNSAQEEFYLRSGCDFNLVHDEKGIILELHWGITPKYFSFPFDPEIWKRLERISFSGRTVLTLHREDLLLTLSVHGSKHLWERLGWICDIATLIQYDRGIDWTRIMKQASALGGERMLLLGLFLAHDLLKAPLPEEILQKVRAYPVVKSLATEVVKQFFEKNAGPPGLLKTCRFHLKMREKFQDKSRYCFRLAVTPTAVDWTFLSLPASLFFAYYLVRPVRIIWKYGVLRLKRFLS